MNDNESFKGGDSPKNIHRNESNSTSKKIASRGSKSSAGKSNQGSESSSDEEEMEAAQFKPKQEPEENKGQSAADTLTAATTPGTGGHKKPAEPQQHFIKQEKHEEQLKQSKFNQQ